MHEIYRCLRDDGVVIYSSVMNFPIYAFPNDYWRFTPEAFRALAGDFPRAMIFFCGPPEFSLHTVCGIATKNNYDPSLLQTLAKRVGEIEKAAPLIVEGRAAKIIQRLVTKLVPPAADVSSKRSWPASIDFPIQVGALSPVNGSQVGPRSTTWTRLKSWLATPSFIARV